MTGNYYISFQEQNLTGDFSQFDEVTLQIRCKELKDVIKILYSLFPLYEGTVYRISKLCWYSSYRYDFEIVISGVFDANDLYELEKLLEGKDI